MNSTAYTIVTAVLAVALGATYLYGSRAWRDRARQRLERAAGGAMSPAALAAFERRDRRSKPWQTGGVLLGLAGWTIATALSQDGGTLFYLIIPVVLGMAAGHLAAALTPLSGQLPQRRLASLTPRALADYISHAQLRGQHIALTLPFIAIILGALALFDQRNATALSVTMIVLGALSLALGFAAPGLRRRLLETPNPAGTVEVAFWNNAIVSRAICDLTETVTLLSLMTGYLACSALSGSTVLSMLPFAGVMIVFGLLVLIGGAVLVTSFGGGIISRVPTFIRLNQPQVGRHA